MKESYIFLFWIDFIVVCMNWFFHLKQAKNHQERDRNNNYHHLPKNKRTVEDWSLLISWVTLYQSYNVIVGLNKHNGFKEQLLLICVFNIVFHQSNHLENSFIIILLHPYPSPCLFIFILQFFSHLSINLSDVFECASIFKRLFMSFITFSLTFVSVFQRLFISCITVSIFLILFPSLIILVPCMPIYSFYYYFCAFIQPEPKKILISLLW